MKLNGRVDTILGSIYWEDGKLPSIHTNAMTREIEQVLKDVDELADLIIFHARVRENAKIMSEPWEM
jgi:hypothetical protein